MPYFDITDGPYYNETTVKHKLSHFEPAVGGFECYADCGKRAITLRINVNLDNGWGDECPACFQASSKGART